MVAVFFCSYFLIVSALRTFGWITITPALAITYLVVSLWEHFVRRAARRET